MIHDQTLRTIPSFSMRFLHITFFADSFIGVRCPIDKRFLHRSPSVIICSKFLGENPVNESEERLGSRVS